MKLNNIFKFIIIGLIVLIFLFVIFSLFSSSSLFSLFSSYSFIEGLTGSNIIDCSQCEVKPSLGNCIQIKDICYNEYPTTNNINNINFEIIDTSYVFCPWNPKCDNSLNNILDQLQRLGISNDKIESGIKDNIQCCGGSNFYNDYTYNINMLQKSQHIQSMCSDINSNDFLRDAMISKLGIEYYKFKNLCNQNDLSGLYFKRDLSSTDNILKNPNLSIQEIIDYQNILELSYGQMSNSLTAQNNNIEISRVKKQIRNLNDELKNLNLNSLRDKNRKIEIQNTLADKYFISTISHKTYEYKLLNNLGTPLGNSYILQENEFFNCFGSKNQVKTFQDISFSTSDITKFNEQNFFDVDSDASYTTMQDNIIRPYPSAQDFEMELKNLPPIQKSDNVSTSIISSYLNSINSFYQKQLNSLIGPKSHSVPQSLQFDNNSLSTKSNTFFVYDGSINTNFDCEPSVTGDDMFKYCGPASYYNEFKP